MIERIGIIKPKGRITMILIGPDGRIKMIQEVSNIVTDVGKAALAARMAAAAPTPQFMSYIAIGSGASEAFSTDTALETELARQSGSQSSSGPIFFNTTTFAAGVGTGTIVEAGMFDAPSGGNMFSRSAFDSPFVKGAGDALEVGWEVTLE